MRACCRWVRSQERGIEESQTMGKVVLVVDPKTESKLQGG
jgi:hypothetical protein